MKNSIFKFSFRKLGGFLFFLFCFACVSAQTVQNINFPDIPVKGYGDTSFVLNASSSSGAITYTSSDATVATISGNTVTIRKIGFSFISAFVNGIGTNASAAPVVQLLVVCPKATLTVKSDAKIISVGDAIPTLTFTTTGFKNSQNTSVISGTPMLTSTANNLVAGTYPIVINRNTLTASNYEFMMEDGTLTVNTSITTWNGSSWSNGVPTSVKEAIINGNYTTAASPGNGTFTARKLTINSGTLTVATGTNLTVVNELINNTAPTGVIIENNANLIQIDNVANTGAITVKRNSNSLKRLDYTMWSSPVGTTQTLSNFSPLTSSNRFYEYNPITNLYSAVTSTSTFSQGKGFLIRMPNEDPDNLGTGSPYYGGTTSIIYKAVFTGIPNNGNINLNSLTTDKYYAIGNPYPSTISANAFLSGNSTAGALYFWRKTNGLANSNSAYATYTTLGGTVAGNIAPNNIIPNGTIQVGQAFIVKTSSAASSLTFNNTMRTTNNNNQFLKTAQETQKDRLWLNLTNASGAFSQTLIGYLENATLDIDNGIDAKYINDSPVALTSSINNEEYVIQGRPAFNVFDIVSLYFKTNLAIDYTIALDHFDGVFATGQDVYLVDNSTGVETNLKFGDYTFTATAGTDSKRFTLKYQKTLKINAPAFNENSILVYKSNDSLCIKSNSAGISNIKVCDLQGRILTELNDVKSNTAVIGNLKTTHQVLIVKIVGEDNNLVIKKVMN